MRKYIWTSFACLVLGMMVTFTNMNLPVSTATTVSANTVATSYQENGVFTAKGQLVKNHVEKTRLKNKGVDRALKDMEKLGKVPNWETSLTVFEKKDLSAQLVRKASFSTNSYAMDDVLDDGSGNQMTIITYYGDSNYWEGTVITYNASTGVIDSYNTVIEDINLADPETADVTDELYYPADGSGPYREEPAGGRYPILIDENRHYSGSNQFDHSEKFINVSSSPKPGFLGFFKRFFRCVKRCNRISAACRVLPQRERTICRITSGVVSGIVCAFNTNACS